MRKLLLLAILMAGLLPAAAQAAPRQPNSRPIANASALFDCGGNSGKSLNHLVTGWKHKHVWDDVKRRIRHMGYSSTDFPNVKALLRDRTVAVPLAHKQRLRNTRCVGGHMRSFGTRVRPKGYLVRVFLPKNMSLEDVCGALHKGCKKTAPTLQGLAQLACGNVTPSKVKVILIVVVVHHPHKPTPTPLPTPSPSPTPTVSGNCNVVVMGSGNNVNVSQCNYTIVIVCSGVNVTFGGPNSDSVNQAVKQYEESHHCNTVVVTPTPTPTPSPSPTPTPPSKAHAWLSKKAYVDNNLVTLSGGEFTFTVSVNGSQVNTVTNAASGSTRDVGEFDGGDVVKVCDPDQNGFTPDVRCITHTMSAGENYTFSFVNRKTTPKPVPSASATSSCPSGGGNGTITVTLSNSGNADAMFAVDVNGSPSSYSVGPGGTKSVSFVLGTSADVRVQVVSNGVKLLDRTFPHCAPPPPGHAKLAKKAYVDGNLKTLSGGEFTFSVSVNGTVKTTVTNAASGSFRDLGDFNVGDTVKVCETDAGDYTPDSVCITHTMSSGETFAFVFINRKTTPPPPPTMQVKNVTSPQEADNDGETYPNLFADAYTPNGDSITCTVGVADPNDHSQSGFGSISGTRSFTFTSHGYDRVGPYTYQAPNDGTGDVVGQYDQIEVTCHDNSDRSVQDAQGFSKPFQITAAPGNPA